MKIIPFFQSFVPIKSPEKANRLIGQEPLPLIDGFLSSVQGAKMTSTKMDKKVRALHTLESKTFSWSTIMKVLGLSTLLVGTGMGLTLISQLYPSQNLQGQAETGSDTSSALNLSKPLTENTVIVQAKKAFVDSAVCTFQDRPPLVASVIDLKDAVFALEDQLKAARSTPIDLLNNWKDRINALKDTIITFQDKGLYSDSKKETCVSKEKVPDGHGIYIWPDGTKYEGEWKNGLREGNGTLTWNHDLFWGRWQNGVRFQGKWKNDLPMGFGTLTDSQGSTYQGYWKKTIIEGDMIFSPWKGHDCIIRPEHYAFDLIWCATKVTFWPPNLYRFFCSML